MIYEKLKNSMNLQLEDSAIIENQQNNNTLNLTEHTLPLNGTLKRPIDENNLETSNIEDYEMLL